MTLFFKRWHNNNLQALNNFDFLLKWEIETKNAGKIMLLRCYISSLVIFSDKSFNL